MNTHLKKTTKQ